MDKDQLEALERRNKLEQELILSKLENIEDKTNDIKEISLSNQRALRGSNGTPGIVAGVRNNCKEIENLRGRNNFTDTLTLVLVSVGTFLGITRGP